MSEPREPIDRLAEFALFAPVGAMVVACEVLERRTRLQRQAVKNRIQLSRFVGQMAVTQGRRQLEQRVAAVRAQRAQPVAVEVPVHEEPIHASPAELAVAAVATSGPETPAAADLPISGYESLPALNVVERLGTLRGDEVELIRRFEAANRARRTILAKIAQIQGD